MNGRGDGKPVAVNSRELTASSGQTVESSGWGVFEVLSEAKKDTGRSGGALHPRSRAASRCSAEPGVVFSTCPRRRGAVGAGACYSAARRSEELTRWVGSLSVHASRSTVRCAAPEDPLCPLPLSTFRLPPPPHHGRGGGVDLAAADSAANS